MLIFGRCSVHLWAEFGGRWSSEQPNSVVDQAIQHKERGCCPHQQRFQWLPQPFPSHRSCRRRLPPRLLLRHRNFLPHLSTGT